MADEQNRARKPAATPDAAREPSPEEEVGALRITVAQRRRAVMRKQGASATAKAAPTLQDACARDPMAARKLQDIMGEAAPRAVAARPGFIEGATGKLQAAPGAPLQALRAEGAQPRYLCLGEPLPPTVLAQSGGVSRVIDLPTLFKFGLLAPKYLATLAPADPEAFISQVRKGQFDPNRHLDNGKEMRGKVAESWWFPTSGASKVDLGKLRKELYIQDNPDYANGAVRLDMPPAELAAQKIELHKPTAFDGLHQGWGDDPWWRASNDAHWGLTKNSTKEAVMPSMKLEKFKQRSLMMPTEKGGKA